MKIERIELHVVSIPLKHAFETSFGIEDREVHIIVKMYAEGLTGYGETPVMLYPGYSNETVETAWHVQKDFIIPAVLNKKINSIGDFEYATKGIRGNNFAKYGFEGAVWDLLAKQRDLPLYRLLGGTRKTIHSGVSVGIEKTEEELLVQIEKFIAEGYKRIKIKIKPGWDVKPVETIRKRFGDIRLMVDANSAYSLNDIPVFQRLDEFGLMMIEQPLHYEDLTAHAELQKKIKTSICLDESISSVSMAEAAVALKSCRVINIKPARVGGLNRAKKIHDLCHHEGIPVWCGGMLEMGIGRAQNIALSTLPNFTFPGDVSSSTKYFDKDIVEPVILLENGELAVPECAGSGYTPNDDTIREYSIRSFATS